MAARQGMLQERFSHTLCEDWGADPDETAARNTEAIQAALNLTGLVTLRKRGTYLINDTLYITDETQFVLGRGVKIKMAPGAKKRLLACDSSRRTPTPVSLTWTTDTNIVTVNWPAHGLTDEDYVCLQGAQLTGTVTGATQANPCVITSSGHNLQTGKRVTFNSDVGGMTQLNGNSYVATRTSANAFSLSSLVAATNSSGFSAYTSGGTWFSIQNEYNNVFRVFEVLDDNRFTVALYETPTVAPGGSITAIKCTRSFSLEGGVWDYDSATSTGSPSELNRHAITLHYAANFDARNVKAINVLKYGFNTMAVADYTCERIEGSGVAEIFKHYGPAVNGSVRGIYGDSIDDCSTVQMREPAAFSNYQPAQGDIVNLSIEDVNVRNVGGSASGAVVVYASNHDRCINLTLEKVFLKGVVCPAIRVRNGDNFTVGRIDDLALVDCFLSGKTTSNYGLFISDVELKNLRLVRPKFVPADLTSPFFSTNAATYIETMIVQEMSFYNEAWPTGGAAMFTLNGVINRAIFERCDIRGQSGLVFVQIPVSQSMGNLILRDSRFEGISAVVDCRSLTNIHRENCTFNNVANGVLRIQTATGLTARVFGAGRNTYAVASEAIVILTPATAEIYDWDLRVDPIALTQLETTLGQYCWSTQATTEGGPSVRGNAGWCALGGGASGVNTLIT
jgi:hypothetical protein